jgi:hypothetical protein
MIFTGETGFNDHSYLPKFLRPIPYLTVSKGFVKKFIPIYLCSYGLFLCFLYPNLSVASVISVPSVANLFFWNGK